MKNICLILGMVPLFSFSQYAEYDWEERDTWMPVKVLFEMAGIEEGIHVADIGCHEGYLTVHLSKEAGELGRIYAVDVRRDRLDDLEDNLDDRDIRNVDVILGEYDDPKLPEDKLDVVFIVDTYHEITEYKKVLRHVYNSLKAGGRLIVLEKLKSWVRNGSRQEQVEAHSLGPEYVRKELVAAGFEIHEIRAHLGNWEMDEDKPMWAISALKPKYSKR